VIKGTLPPPASSLLPPPAPAGAEKELRVLRWMPEGDVPLAPELSALAFTLEGQTAVKGRSEGRYSRVAGLFSAAILAQALGELLEAIERDGLNVFRVSLTPL
jgi:hypothetical protein